MTNHPNRSKKVERQAHTPGPWSQANDDTPWTEGNAEIAQECDEEFGCVEVMFSIVDANDEVICRIPFNGGDTAEDQERTRANARLIADAPEIAKQRDELLAALEAITSAYDSCSGVDDYIQLTPKITLADVKSLIANARKGAV